MLLKIEIDEESDSGDSSLTMGNEEDEVDDDDDHHLLTESNSDVAFLQETPVRLAKDLL